MKHLINKLTFDVGCSDERQAFAMREQFLHELYEEMVSVIEMCCNRASDDLHLIQLDKLEVNLKTFKNKFLDKQAYIHLFGEAFEKELKKKLPIVTKKQTESQSQRNILSWFLLTGTLPWWADGKGIDLDEWCNKIQEGSEGTKFILWLKANKNQPEVWERIAWQLPARFKSFVIAAIPELTNARTTILNSYSELAERRKLPFFAEDRLSELVNNFVIRGGDFITNEAKPVLAEGLFEQFLAAVLSDADIQTLPGSLAEGIMNKRDKTRSLQENLPVDSDDKVLPDTDSKIRTAHAGIVLIAAFLQEYYQRMGLWKDRDWAQEGDAHKAVYLLYYMATGSQSPFEYELPLEKIMCGIPIGMPLNRDHVLTEEEIKEADELLRSVIQHWTALKNTSIAGLRQAFFQREGLLSLKNNNWILEVERKTMDILLEQLPWGYATVTLPWNKYLIFTEW